MEYRRLMQMMSCMDEEEEPTIIQETGDIVRL